MEKGKPQRTPEQWINHVEEVDSHPKSKAQINCRWIQELNTSGQGVGLITKKNLFSQRLEENEGKIVKNITANDVLYKSSVLAYKSI